MSAYEFYGAWPHHIAGPGDAFRVWFMKPATLVFAVAARETDAELVKVYMRPIDAIRRRKALEIDAAGGIATIADFRFTEFTKTARIQAKEYYKTSAQKGTIRARYIAVKNSRDSTMNHKLLSMNTTLMTGNLPIVKVPHPRDAMRALGASKPEPDLEIAAIRAALSW